MARFDCLVVGKGTTSSANWLSITWQTTFYDGKPMAELQHSAASRGNRINWPSYLAAGGLSAVWKENVGSQLGKYPLEVCYLNIPSYTLHNIVYGI